MKLIKLLSIGLLSLMALVACTKTESKNKVKTDWELFGLKGKVKSIKVIEQNPLEKELGKVDSTKVQQYFFNKKGQRVKDSYFNLVGDLQTTTYMYDSSGRKTRETIQDVKGTLVIRFSYDFDDRGNEIARFESYPTGFSDKWLYKYDDNDNLIEEEAYGSAEKLTSRSLYQYDSKGNKIALEYYNSDAVLESKFTWQYDEKGRVVEEASMYPSYEAMSCKCFNKYDEQGNQIEAVLYYGESNKTVYACRYEYDSKGNWIEKTELKDNVPQKYIKRELEYYD